MEKEQNVDLDEEKDGVDTDEAGKDDVDDEFEYDDEGNIIIPDVIEDEEQAEEDGEDDAESADETDDGDK